MSALLLLVLAQLSGPPAIVDLRGHSPAALQSVLEGQLLALTACRTVPSESTARKRTGPVVRSGPVEVTVEVVVAPTGMVVVAKVPSSGAFVDDCLHHQLLKLEFGPRPHDATSRETLVTATLRCTQAVCWWSWMTPPEAG